MGQSGQSKSGKPGKLSGPTEPRDRIEPRHRIEPSDQREPVVRRGDGSRARQPRGSTRERILDIALELFTEQGYDKTSLRDIAEHLGTTKAALYYHFERKEDILLELHLRLHALGQDVLDELERLDDGQQRADAWPDLLDHFIDQVLSNRELFLLHQRNHNALEALQDSERHQAAQEDLEQQFRRVIASPVIPLAQRVRMACSIGAVMSVLLGAEALFGDAPLDDVAEIVRAVARDIVGCRE